MSAQILDGRHVAGEIESRLVRQIATLASEGIRPGLVAIRVGDDPASEIYVRNKARKAEELGLSGVELALPSRTSESSLLRELDRLNRDESVDGILVQLPLPSHIATETIIESIDPQKDVDGFHPSNVGRLHLGQPALTPCTPAGIIELIRSTGVAIRGLHAVVVGRSNIVGKPVAAMLLQSDATTTISHSRTADLGSITRQADILVAAAGRPLMIDASMIKPGSIVIDVGINRISDPATATTMLAHDQGKLETFNARGNVLVGDVDFGGAREIASWITPVPGGVGPMTIIMLMSNTVAAAMGRRR
ncbi:MAG TPA: tetrahydrofolate dehydrogenase/cyclohydrolase catalytic domain-containing protein [Thermoanaerobaculia bacterium]|nr:tetrahydrofolate dehydrogenase/cyclohydrolase catalytic domain-containing protein [Thermoanaerobaculia bacterium]